MSEWALTDSVGESRVSEAEWVSSSVAVCDSLITGQSLMLHYSESYPLTLARLTTHSLSQSLSWLNSSHCVRDHSVTRVEWLQLTHSHSLSSLTHSVSLSLTKYVSVSNSFTECLSDECSAHCWLCTQWLNESLTTSITHHCFSLSVTVYSLLSLSHELEGTWFTVRIPQDNYLYQTMCPLRHHHMEEEVEVSEERERTAYTNQLIGTLCTK